MWSGGIWKTAIDAAFNALGDKYVRTTRFILISSGTSGTATLPPNATVVLDDFGGTVDAVVCEASGGRPTFSQATNSSGDPITTSFDASGNYLLSDTPDSYPIALVYRVQQKLSEFDDQSSSIVGPPQFAGTSGSSAGIQTYITFDQEPSLINARRLLGTSNQVQLSDGGAGGDLTLSLPQDIHTAATPTFGGVTLGTLSGVLKASAGVVSGSATTTNLPEGTNLYYTDVRADARIAAQKGAANGIATLGADSKIPSSQLPAIAITDTFVVVSQAAMLALTAQTGDVAVRTDLNKSFILAGTDPTVLGDWQELLTPTDAVLSVNGQTGIVVLTTSDVAEGSRLYFTNARAIASTLTAYSAGAGTVSSSDSILTAIQKIDGNTAAISGAVTSISAFGSTPNNAGGSIATNALTLQPADGTHPGGVSTTTQTFAGDKTFSGAVTAASYNKVAITAPATSATLAIADGASLVTSGGFSLTLTATGATNVTLPTTGTLATLAGAEALSNKTIGNTNTLAIKDTLFTLQDDGDATKLLAFQLSGISTGTTRTMTAPNLSGTIMLTDATQTVTGTLTVTGTVTVDDSAFSIRDATNTAEKLAFQIDTTSGSRVTTIATGVQTGNRTFTFPVTTSDTITTIAATQTISNKRLVKRTGTVTSNATPTINTDNVDYFSVTALATAITSMTTNLSGTPNLGDTLWISFLDNGTARAITWGASFESSGNVTLPTTTVISTQLDVGFCRNQGNTKWHCVAVA